MRKKILKLHNGFYLIIIIIIIFVQYKGFFSDTLISIFWNCRYERLRDVCVGDIRVRVRRRNLKAKFGHNF